MNSVHNVFVDVNVKGCFFNLSQNIWRKIQQNRLAVLYVCGRGGCASGILSSLKTKDSKHSSL